MPNNDSHLTPYQFAILNDFLSVGARFLLVGGFAMRAFGIQRATEDIDVLVPPSHSAAELVLPIIRRRVISSLHEKLASRLMRPNQVIRLNSKGVHEMDILTSIGMALPRSS